jgi:prepilin-type N-terminal cleavage/methylation domain-containing protein
MACGVLELSVCGLENSIKPFGKLNWNMLVCCRQTVERKPRVLCAAFTLVEILVSMVILTIVMAGVIYGYTQANRFAEWSSMSLAAQSYALQGLEQVRAAKWDLSATPVWDDLPVSTNSALPVFTESDIMDIPVSGAPFYVTNYIYLTQISTSPQIRQIRSACLWTFPRTGKLYTNTVITWRAADRQ